MKSAVLMLLILVSVSSCTITKQRYSRGFHVEWKKRPTTKHSKTASPLFDEKELVITKDTVVKTVNNQLSNETQTKASIEGQQENLRNEGEKSDEIIKTPITTSSPFNNNWEPPVQATSKKNNIIHTKAVQQQQTKSAVHNSNFWEAVTDFLFWMAIVLLFFTISPVLHTILIDVLPGYDWKTTLFIVSEWLLWVGGIVAILLLLSGVWTILLACFGWNLLIAMVGTAIVINM